MHVTSFQGEAFQRARRSMREASGFETLNQYNWICWIHGTVGGCLLLIRLESALHNQTYTLIQMKRTYSENCYFSFYVIKTSSPSEPWVHSCAHFQSIQCIEVFNEILNKPFLFMQSILIFRCDNLLQVFLSNHNNSNNMIYWEYCFNW